MLRRSRAFKFFDAGRLVLTALRNFSGAKKDRKDDHGDANPFGSARPGEVSAWGVIS